MGIEQTSLWVYTRKIPNVMDIIRKCSTYIFRMWISSNPVRYSRFFHIQILATFTNFKHVLYQCLASLSSYNYGVFILYNIMQIFLSISQLIFTSTVKMLVAIKRYHTIIKKSLTIYLRNNTTTVIYIIWK